MAVNYLFSNISFILFFILISYLNYTTKAHHQQHKTSGPFKATIEAVNDCETPSRPYLADSPISVNLKVFNVSNRILLGGNATIKRNTHNVKYRIKSFIWENEKWSPNFIMNDLGCRSKLLPVICAATGLKYDKKRCMFLKAQYYFKEIDVNALQHIWTSKMEYGKMMWRCEIFNSQSTLFCIECMTITVPA